MNHCGKKDCEKLKNLEVATLEFKRLSKISNDARTLNTDWLSGHKYRYDYKKASDAWMAGHRETVAQEAVAECENQL